MFTRLYILYRLYFPWHKPSQIIHPLRVPPTDDSATSEKWGLNSPPITIIPHGNQNGKRLKISGFWKEDSNGRSSMIIIIDHEIDHCQVRWSRIILSKSVPNLSHPGFCTSPWEFHTQTAHFLDHTMGDTRNHLFIVTWKESQATRHRVRVRVETITLLQNWPLAFNGSWKKCLKKTSIDLQSTAKHPL